MRKPPERTDSPRSDTTAASASATADAAVGRLDLAQAAQALSVHYQTAYRWVRSGVLPATMDKGVYRIDQHEIDQLLAARASRPPSRRSNPTAESIDKARRQMNTALLDGDEPVVTAMARRWADRTTVTVTLDRIVAPALREIGQGWHEGRVSIWREHRASSIVMRLLGDLAAPRPGRRRGTAVVTTIAGEHHSLPAQMAVAALREDNWLVHHLGTDLPPDELVDFCRGHHVDLAVVTVTSGDSESVVVDLERSVRQIVPRVLVGGPGRTLTELQLLARDDDLGDGSRAQRAGTTDGVT